jgi:YHS domain-containing protein
MAVEVDPVCGMEVDTETSTLSYELDGKTYWFCSKGCLLDFKEDPAKYLAPGYEASM